MPQLEDQKTVLPTNRKGLALTKQQELELTRQASTINDAVRSMAERATAMFRDFQIPQIKLPEIPKETYLNFPIDDKFRREENAWKRHDQLITSVSNLQEVQNQQYKEGKKANRVQWTILGFTAAGFVVAVLALLKSW